MKSFALNKSERGTEAVSFESRVLFVTELVSKTSVFETTISRGRSQSFDPAKSKLTPFPKCPTLLSRYKYRSHRATVSAGIAGEGKFMTQITAINVATLIEIAVLISFLDYFTWKYLKQKGWRKVPAHATSSFIAVVGVFTSTFIFPDATELLGGIVLTYFFVAFVEIVSAAVAFWLFPCDECF